jgi:hypothetical protein
VVNQRRRRRGGTVVHNYHFFGLLLVGRERRGSILLASIPSAVVPTHRSKWPSAIVEWFLMLSFGDKGAEDQELKGPAGEDKKDSRKLIPPMIHAANIKLRGSVNPVRNSSRVLNSAGIILKSNLTAEQRGIIPNGVNLDRFIRKFFSKQNR